MEKNDKWGLRIIIILFLVSWTLTITQYIWLRIVGIVTLGLIGFSLWRIIEGIIEENEKKGGNKNGK